MAVDKHRVPSGVNRLDLLLGGLFIGDHVVWHDDAVSLAPIFCLNFLQASELQEKPINYVCFDRSPKSLLEKLGHLAEYPALTVLDCFTSGQRAKTRAHLSSIMKKPMTCRARWSGSSGLRTSRNSPTSFTKPTPN